MNKEILQEALSWLEEIKKEKQAKGHGTFAVNEVELKICKVLESLDQPVQPAPTTEALKAAAQAVLDQWDRYFSQIGYGGLMDEPIATLRRALKAQS